MIKYMFYVLNIHYLYGDHNWDHDFMFPGYTVKCATGVSEICN